MTISAAAALLPVALNPVDLERTRFHICLDEYEAGDKSIRCFVLQSCFLWVRIGRWLAERHDSVPLCTDLWKRKK
jgi:hypothetical protein